jgi:hypothetical protein
MSNVLLFKHELSEFVESIEKLSKELFKTKRILKFIDNNGINSFKFISKDIFIACEYCSNEYHNLHENKYSYKVLDDILEENWVDDIFKAYFKELSFKDFLDWLKTYVSSFCKNIENLTIQFI